MASEVGLHEEINGQGNGCQRNRNFKNLFGNDFDDVWANPAPDEEANAHWNNETPIDMRRKNVNDGRN